MQHIHTVCLHSIQVAHRNILCTVQSHNIPNIICKHTLHSPCNLFHLSTALRLRVLGLPRLRRSRNRGKHLVKKGRSSSDGIDWTG
jgi:hypothetical protein